MITHTVHYERFSPNLNKRVQGTTTIRRDKPLIISGAQRILRSRKILNGVDRRGWETTIVLSVDRKEES